MYKRKKISYLPQQKTFGLNVTSMTDMFTILLVFLLQNFATSEFSLDPDPAVKLPSSTETKAPEKRLQIILNSKELKLDNQLVLSLDTTTGGTSLDQQSGLKINRLYEALVQLKEKNTQDASVIKGEILFQADRNQSYKSIQKVMYTASQAGFPKVKLATLAGN